MNLFIFVWSQGKPFLLKQILITLRWMIKICFSFSHFFKQKKNGCFSVHISNIYIKIKTWNKSIYKRLQRKKINMDNFYKFYQECCRFSVGITFRNWVSCFSKHGGTRSTSFSNFNPFNRKYNFHWSWKSLEWRFSHILSNHFSSPSGCHGERVFGRISK